MHCTEQVASPAWTASALGIQMWLTIAFISLCFCARMALAQSCGKDFSVVSTLLFDGTLAEKSTADVTRILEAQVLDTLCTGVSAAETPGFVGESADALAARLKLVAFADAQLQRAADAASVAQLQALVVEHTLKAMRRGAGAALQRFPRALGFISAAGAEDTSARLGTLFQVCPRSNLRLG